DGAVERGGFGRIAEGFARTTGPVGSLEAERAARRAHLVPDPARSCIIPGHPRDSGEAHPREAREIAAAVAGDHVPVEGGRAVGVAGVVVRVGGEVAREDRVVLLVGELEVEALGGLRVAELGGGAGEEPPGLAYV